MLRSVSFRGMIGCVQIPRKPLQEKQAGFLRVGFSHTCDKAVRLEADTSSLPGISRYGQVSGFRQTAHLEDTETHPRATVSEALKPSTGSKGFVRVGPPFSR